MAVDLRRFLSALTRSIISWSRAVMISSRLHVVAPEELVRTYLPAELTLSATDDAVSNVLSCLLHLGMRVGAKSGGLVGSRFRKSFKLAPGIRMTVTPKGLGVSAGPREQLQA